MMTGETGEQWRTYLEFFEVEGQMTLLACVPCDFLWDASG